MKIAITDKQKALFLNVINIITLSTYALLLIIQMRRYFYDDFNIYFFKAGFLCYGILALICCFKIFYYLHVFPLYSLLSSNILILSFWLCSFKARYSTEELISHWPALLTTLLLIISMMQIPTDYIIKTFFATIGFIYVVRVFMSTVLDVPSVIACLKTGEGLELGFGNHNFPMVLFFFLVLSWIYISRNRKNRLVDATIIFVFTVILAVLTRSKTSTLLLVITITIVIAQSLINCDMLGRFESAGLLIKRIGGIYALLSPIVLVFVSIGGAIGFNFYMITYPDSISDINNVSFMSRFSTLSYDFAYNHIWLPFQYLEVPPYELYTHFSFSPITGGGIYMDYSDNVCHYLICYHGFIVFSLFIGMLIYLCYKAFKNAEASLLIVIALISTFSIMERSALLYFSNPFLIILVSTFYPYTKPSQTI